jgi:hypothetical protein
MATPKILKDIEALPPEAQKQVSDFVAFLKTRYSLSSSKRSRRVKLAKEPFIGMWIGREDMRDSTQWVRQLRRSQWNRKS